MSKSKIWAETSTQTSYHTTCIQKFTEAYFRGKYGFKVVATTVSWSHTNLRSVNMGATKIDFDHAGIFPEGLQTVLTFQCSNMQYEKGYDSKCLKTYFVQ